ncbi:MAG: lipopolysaccharide kinase InaA family protein [Paludibacteraceae bacterium]|nr:lipopolysaccharide kinase InaA family protein [Paludibacteraceae bacterium]
MIIINPKYDSLRAWIESLPNDFSTTGEIIYDARNQIRRFEVDNLTLCVKRFHQPRFLNRLIYSFLRPSKARRSYENGMYLMRHGVGTPEPVAYIEEKKWGLMGFNYLITLQSQLTRLHREFTLNYTPELEDTIRPLARFTAKMHDEGILHLDYSPGNILWDQVNGAYQFEVIDINRMRIGKPVTLKEGAKSLRRICARTAFFVTFADEYAVARGLNKDDCTTWILYYRNRFWKNGQKARYNYD